MFRYVFCSVGIFYFNTIFNIAYNIITPEQKTGFRFGLYYDELYYNRANTIDLRRGVLMSKNLKKLIRLNADRLMIG